MLLALATGAAAQGHDPREASGTSWQPAATPMTGSHTDLVNGREPDDQRAGLEFAPLDSVSARVAIAPNDYWSMQVSAGRLHESEAGLGSQPRQDVDRATASAHYVRPLASGAIWANTLAYGVNHEVSEVPDGTIEQSTHAVLAESSLRSASGRHHWFGRFEVVGKPAHDLHVHEYITEIFTVGKGQVGYLHQFGRFHGWAPGFGVFVNLQPER